jgi:hypothetical protein
MKQTLKKIWTWIKENPWAILSAIVSVFSAYLVYKAKDNKINSLTDAVAVQSTLKNIAADEAKAAVLKASADAKEDDVKALDKRIADSKRRVMEIHEGTRLEAMSDEDVARLFGDTRI